MSVRTMTYSLVNFLAYCWLTAGVVVGATVGYAAGATGDQALLRMMGGGAIGALMGMLGMFFIFWLLDVESHLRRIASSGASPSAKTE